MNKYLDIIHTTDDGYNSVGYNKIKKIMSLNEFNYISVVPLYNKSGFSASIDEIDVNNIKVIKSDKNEIVLDTTPVNCIRWAIKNGYNPKVIVVGINDGMNLQNDIFLSGTVMTACYSANKGYKSIAISQENIKKDHTEIINNNIANLISLDKVKCLSLNIPDNNNKYNDYIKVLNPQDENKYIKENKCTLRTLNFQMI